jgi:hypothetical protein
MNKSTSSLQDMLRELSAAARRQGLTDTVWAKAAGVRNETLSRLRSRSSCDLSTLVSLADRVGARLVLHTDSALQPDATGHMPAHFGRDEEALLLTLVSSGDVDAQHWRNTGPAFFMAGLAVLLAGVRGYDRQRLLQLAEDLHPGSSQTAVYALWLDRSPLEPSRFLPQLEQMRHAA